MNILPRVRTCAGLTTCSVLLALFTLASGVSTSFAAEQPSTVRSTTVDHGDLDARSVTSIIMRDGGPCDPIRHMGC